MPAGHANRTAPRTHVVSPGEAGARLHQPVEVGGFDIGYPETSDGFVTLVVGKDEEDVWLLGRVKKGRAEKDRREE